MISVVSKPLPALVLAFLAAVVVALACHWADNRLELSSAYNAMVIPAEGYVIVAEEARVDEGRAFVSFEQRNTATLSIAELDVPAVLVDDLAFDLTSENENIDCTLVLELTDKRDAVPLGRGCRTERRLTGRIDNWRGEIKSLQLTVRSPRGNVVGVGGMHIKFRSYADKLHFDVRALLEIPYLWNQRTINYMQAGETGSGLSANYVLVALALLVLVFYFSIMSLSGKKARTSHLMAIVFLAWLAADARWLVVVFENAVQASDLYAGKTYAEKRSEGIDPLDGRLYDYAEDLKEAVLPDGVSKIIMVHKGDSAGYIGSRLYYDLLPHKIDKVDETSRRLRTIRRFFDYVVIATDVNAIYYDRDARALKLRSKEGDKKLARAELVSRSQFARVYRIEGPET